MALKISSVKNTSSADGEWIDIAEWPGVRFKVRSINSRDYQIAREMLLQKLTRKLGRLPTSPEMEPQLGRLVATMLWRGWEGLNDDADKAVEYSAQQAIDYLTDPEMLALELQVLWAANRVGDRDAEFTTAAVKNSDAPSATT